MDRSGVVETKQLDACPSWDDPIPLGQHGLDCVEHLVPYWRRLVHLIHPYRDDPLVAKDWKASVEAFDMHPTPELRDIWILRWRRLVVDTWRLLDAHQARLRLRPKPRTPAT